MPARSHLGKYLQPALAGLLFCLFLTSPALAVNYAWNGGAAGDWGDPANWTPEPPAGPGVPGPGDAVFFESDATVTLGANRVVDAVYLDTADTAFDGGGTFSLTTATLTDMSASSLTMSNAGDNLIVTTSFDLQNSGLLLSGPGEFTVQGSNTIDCGVAGYFNLDNNVKLNLNGNQTIGLITGTGNWGGGTEIRLSNGATLTLSTTGAAWGNYMGVISGNGNLALAFSSGYSLTGSNTYTGWTRVISGELQLYGSSNILPNTTTLQVDGGAKCSPAEQTLAGISGAGTIEIWSDDTLTVNQSGSGAFSGNITQVDGSEILEKTGNGSLTLTGTVQPEVRVQDGTLVVNGNAQNGVRIFGGTLLGIGTIDVLGLNGGTLSPGNSVGTLSINIGSLMYAGGTYLVEVSGGAADRLDVTGSVSIDDTTLNVTGVPVKGAQYTIINNDAADAVTGTFGGLAEGETFRSGRGEYEISYQGDTGNDVVLTCLYVYPAQPAPEPEPEPSGPSAPSVPQGSGPSPSGSLDGIALSWSKVEGATYYLVYRADCPTCPRKKVGGAKENIFIDNTAPAGQPFYYWLRSGNDDGLGGYSNWMAAWRYEQDPGRAGDFNGDGIMDLLWWDPVTNQIYIWFMSGGQVIGVSSPMDGLDINDWLLIGTGDFNDDGACDLLWWKPETGEILFWYMQPSMATAESPLFQAMSDPISQTMPSHAALSYPGDLNGDGFLDMLWRDYASGDVAVWLMGEDGKPLLTGPPIPADDDIIKGERPGLSGRLEWQVAGLADADGDGKADVIWQDERNNHLVTWFMDGPDILRAVEENKGLDTVWRLPGLGDLNGDRMADIVWRNEASGEVKAWLMQAGVFSEERVIIEGSDEATQWQVKAVGDFCSPGCDDVYFKHSETGAAKIAKLDGEQFTPVVE
jgi:hypothetical protein